MKQDELNDILDRIDRLSPASAGALNLAPLSASAQHDEHRRRLHAVAFTDGKNGVDAYRRLHPDSDRISVKINALAYVKKPKGYHEYMVGVVDRWVNSEAAIAATNKEDVDRLNLHFQTTRFNSANHFSKIIDASLLLKIRLMLSSYGIPVNVSTTNTMSKLKQAVKATKRGDAAARSFGGIGTLSEDALRIGQRIFRVEPHSGHACIRVRRGSKRGRLRLDFLEEVFDSIVAKGAMDDPLSIITSSNMGELVPKAKMPICSCHKDSRTGELVPTSHVSLSSRIAALSAAWPAEQQAINVYGPVTSETDPLALFADPEAIPMGRV